MVWHTVAPVGTDSVASNKTTLQDNTTYTETTMKVDHFWNNTTANYNGHHQFVQTLATNDADSSLETNATLAAGMDLAFFSRFKTLTEMPGPIQDVQPYAINNTDVMQLLGIRACAVFTPNGTGAATLVYEHNVTSVTREATAGRYDVGFAAALPTNSYLFTGGGVSSSGTLTNVITCTIRNTGGAALTTFKSTTGFKMVYNLITGSAASTNTDPVQGWFVVFGG